jgi:hypothetical protein
MSKATSDHITRRAVVAGAGAMLPASALAASASQPDPIFAAIDAYRAAKAEWEAASTLFDRLWEGYEQTGPTRASVQVGMLCHGRHDRAAGKWEIERAVVKHSTDAIVAEFDRLRINAHSQLTGEQLTAELAAIAGGRADALAEFGAISADVEARFQASGCGEAEDRQDKLAEVRDAALEAVYAIVPKTAAGLLALLDFFMTEERHSAVSTKDDALQSIAAATRAILGPERGQG